MDDVRRRTTAYDGETERFLKTEFLERVAHELRGPSGVTLGALDELELELADLGASPRVRMLLAMARRGARRVLRTADRLSRTAQLESGHANVAPFPSDLRAIVSAASLDASEIEGRTSVTVETLLPDKPCIAAADGSWLGAAISEIVAQAIRAAVRNVRVEVGREGDELHVDVSDDRALAPESEQPRFDTRGPRRDTNLDGPIIRDVARMHGVALEITDLRDQTPAHRGSRTRIRMPAVR